MTNRRGFIKTLGTGALAALAPGMRGAENGKKPNILFIFADDQCFETIRALGFDQIHTPNLDRLVKSGTTFTHAYNQGSWSGAVCIASRCMLNTGRFLWHAQKVYRSAEKERKAGRFWSEYMKGAGYETYMTGKWHVRADAKKAFDVAAHVRGGMPNQTKEGYNRPIEGKEDPWKPWDRKFGGYWKGGTHWSEVVGDDAEDFLGKAATSDAPFFMYIAFNAPHDPRQSPKKYVDRYPPEKVRVPKNFLPEYPFKDKIGCGKGLRDERLAPFPRTKYAVKINRREYYAIITHMDAQIGRILAALEKSGKADNTYIFFSADHGLAVGHHGLIGKQNLFDHSVRVPLMVSGPGVAQGRKIATPVYLQDIMPSTLELAGVRKPDHVQFRSLLPLMDGRRDTSYDAVYGGYFSFQRMVTKGNWKLLLYPRIKKVLLFDLAKDPAEMNDRSGDPAVKPVIKKLFAELLKLQKETGDTLDLRAVYPGLS